MANIITAYSPNDGPAHHVNFTDAAGVQQAGPVATTYAGANTHRYTAVVPAIAAGHYTYSMHRSDNSRLRATGEFYWDGTDIVHTEEIELDSAAVQAAVATALVTYDVATESNLDAQTSQIDAAITALNDVSAAELEAALLNDTDGQALLAGIAQAVEQAFNNETDGSPTLAAIQGVVSNALATYDGPTKAELDTCCSAIQTDIASLNDVSTADIDAALLTYDGPTKAELDACCNAIQIDIASLNDLSIADIGSALTSYDVVNQTDLDAAVTGISADITAQQTDLTFLKNVAEADEVYTPTSAQKLLKGTSTVLVDKAVTSDTECTINTTLIEAP